MRATSIFLGNQDCFAHLRFGNYKSETVLMPKPQEYLQFAHWDNMDFALNSSCSVGKNTLKLTNKILDVVNQSYIDEPDGEEGNCSELIDDINDFLLTLDEESLIFLIKWPYFRENISDLGYAVNNGVPLYPILENTEKIICEAMVAKKNGLFISGTEMFVNSNNAGQINQEQLKDLIEAVKMLDGLGFGISSTSYLNLKSFEDDSSYAVAWRGLNLTDINSFLENDLICNKRVSLAQYLGHEDSHHVWDELIPDGVILDPELKFDRGSYLTVDDNPNEILGEVLANALDINLALNLKGKNDLNRYRLDENCIEIDRLILELRQPQYKGNMTEQGLYIMDQAESLNRRNWFFAVNRQK